MNPITTAILLPIALWLYCWRHRNDPPFRQQWYRGCGWYPPRASDDAGPQPHWPAGGGVGFPYSARG